MTSDQQPSITVTTNGPYLVRGPLPIKRQTIETNAEGQSVSWREGEAIAVETTKVALCRCGHSANKPFCDGTHAKIDFDGSETATHAPYLEQAQETDGPILGLTDAEALCAFGRFCDVGGQIWNLVEQDDPQAARLAEREAKDCPGGRLVTWRRSHEGEPEAVDIEVEPEIGLIEDPAEGVAGGLRVWGGVPVVSADGTRYEVRQRVTLCRCGASSNKPFCDGSHVSVKFQD